MDFNFLGPFAKRLFTASPARVIQTKPTRPTQPVKQPPKLISKAARLESLDKHRKEVRGKNMMQKRNLDIGAAENLTSVVDPRREKLLKWKNEKINKEKSAAVPAPFKAGLPFVTLKFNKVSAPPPVVEPPTRRVTRAMTKRVISPPKKQKLQNVKENKHSGETRKPISQTDKAKPKVKTATEKIVTPSDPKVPPVPVAEVQQQKKAPEVAPVPAKKAKKVGMKFDEHYAKHNTTFTTTCSLLQRNLTTCAGLLDSLLPPHVESLINSTIGQTNLLLSSKLPQFAELLYNYLMGNSDVEILACDLEGWWDVAMLSVDAVLLKYSKLDQLRQNDWVEVVEAPASTVSKKSAPPPAQKPKTTTASSGLMEFLKAKRNKNSGGTSDPDPVENSQVLRTPSRVTRSSLAAAAGRTPGSVNRRLSHVTEKMLQVRISMGAGRKF